jgi:hypothetical protein
MGCLRSMRPQGDMLKVCSAAEGCVGRSALCNLSASQWRSHDYQVLGILYGSCSFSRLSTAEGTLRDRSHSTEPRTVPAIQEDDSCCALLQDDPLAASSRPAMLPPSLPQAEHLQTTELDGMLM